MAQSRRVTAISHSALLGAGTLCLAGLGAVAIDAVRLGNLGAAVFPVAAGGLALAAARLAAARSAARDAKLSADVSLIARRLLQLEAQAGTSPGANIDLELATDMSALSELTRDLAERLARHEAAFAKTNGRVPDPAPPPAAPAPGRRDESLGAAGSPGALAAFAPPAPLPPKPFPKLVETAESLPRAEALPTVELLARPPTEDPAFRAVAAAWARDGLELFLQPIVSLPQRRPRFYEAEGRLRLEDDRLAGAAEVRAALGPGGQVAEYDRAVLARALAVARYLATRESGAAVAVALSIETLDDAEAPALLDRMVREAAPGRCVLLLPEGTLRGRADLVGRLRRAGAEIASADDAAWPLDRASLRRSELTFVRVPAPLLLAEAADPGATADLVRQIEDAGVALVASGIAREAEIPDLLDLGVPLAQGAAIGPPRPVRAGILVEAPAPAAVARAVAEAGGGAVSLRQYLGTNVDSRRSGP